MLDIILNCPFLYDFESNYYVDSIINSQKVNISQNERDLRLINYAIERNNSCFLSINKILNDYQLTGYLSFQTIALGFRMKITFLYSNNNKTLDHLLKRFISFAILSGIEYIEVEVNMTYYKKLLETGFVKTNIVFDKITGDFLGVNMIKKLID